MFKPSLLSIFHPSLTFRLLLIIAFLALITLGSAFGVYDSMIHNNPEETFQSFIRMLLYGIPAYGLLKLKRWARLLEMAIAAICVILGFILMIAANMVVGIILIVLHGLILLYLSSKECRQVFGLTSKNN